MMLLNLLGRYPRRNGLVLLSDAGAFSLSLSSGLASSSIPNSTSKRSEPELEDFTDYLDSLRNYEKLGLPKGAGTDSDQGFDLDPMTRLLYRLGIPQSKFKAIHIAGTKGKGSTAAFISNILRAQGYSVGCYTSPHILSIRERMSLGKSGEPVSAGRLSSLFQQIMPRLDEAIQQERGRLSHFEVLTAIAFTLFAEEKVDIAVIEAGLGGARDATNVISANGLLAAVITTIGEEHLAALGGSLESIAMAKAGIIKNFRPLVLGGPFLPHIERILRDYAYFKSSPVVLASDTGVKTTVKGLDMLGDRPYQLSDIMIQIDRSFQLSIELSDLKLRMLGSHQLQNASTAVCTALCLHDQGWSISEESIRAGLENTCLIGRSQFLSSKESKALGLPGATVLLDGAHTKESAKALVDTIRMSFPESHLGLVVAMATDKDHIAFAREFLSSGQLAVVSLIENEIGGGKHRTTPASVLRDCWIQASQQLGINILHDEMAEYQELLKDRSIPGGGVSEDRIVLHAAGDRLQVESHIWHANDILRLRTRNQQSVLVVTGSLHIVSSVLAALRKHNAPCSITDN